MIISLIATWLKRLGAVCLVFVILWHVTPHGAPRRGQAVVHLTSADDVVVWIDRTLYRVRSLADTPVVCDLPPGAHVVQVWRHGFLVAEENFTVEPGRVVVIGPIDRPAFKVGAASGRPAPAAAEVGPAGLAARMRRSEPAPVTN